MKNKPTVYAFIDSNNLYLGTLNDLKWKLDFKKFRVYLKEKYNVVVAYLFIGYVPSNQNLYSSLQKAGYVLIFKPISMDKNGEIKGNVDSDIVLQALLDYQKYDKAVIVSSDGDFYSLVKYLYSQNKLLCVISPYFHFCSILLKKEAKEKIVFMNNLREKLEYQRKSTA